MLKLFLQLTLIAALNISFLYSQATFQWAQSYNGPGNGNDVAVSVKSDNMGHLFVTGPSVGSGTGVDYATVKRNTDGSLNWVARFNGTFNSDDIPTSTAIDFPAGDIIVVGKSTEEFGGFDIVTVKFNTNGQAVWQRNWNGQGNTDDVGTAVAIDNNHNIYVAGTTDFPSNIVLIKYNSIGVVQWSVTYNGTGNFNDAPTGIVCDAAGNIYITGTAANSGSGMDYVVLKYNTNGSLLWVQTYNGTGNSTDLSTAIETDQYSNIYVTGTSIGNGSDSDFVTIKYNTNGQPQWTQRYNGSQNGPDVSRGLAVDFQGNVFVTGSSYGGILSALDYATVKYDASGNLQWERRYNGPGIILDVPTSIAVDAAGNAYVTGASYGGTGTNLDFATLKYSSTGNTEWTVRYDSPYHDNEFAVNINVSNDASAVYVSGTSVGSGTGFDFITVKYTQPPITAINQNGNNIPDKFSLYESYPNPFNPSTNIKFDLPQNTMVKLVVYDINGREVATLVNNEMQAGSYVYNWNASNLASGAYFFRINAGDFTDTKKMMLVK
ncbi:MAG: T9SS C-terminal target domain-containing protein [Ignavibacteriae bacterium]|nr:MAG: T9SS C-terminal target domain-containing protein [Ignavibacteriota bacterium]